jgi:solute carrier family 25 (mitochondrial aspartate/glutamate transporter), member 12/13
MLPLISRLFPTVHCDSKPGAGAGGVIATVRSAVSAPENELRRWRRTFESNAKAEVEGQKYVSRA